jgi:hypothetical protein
LPPTRSLLDLIDGVSPTKNRNDGKFAAGNSNRDTRQMWTNPEHIARADPPIQYFAEGSPPCKYSETDAALLSDHAVETQQRPQVVPTDVNTLPGLATHTLLPGATSHRHISPPLEIAPWMVAKPTAVHKRSGYLSRHFMDNANIHHLTVPTPLAPPDPNQQTRPSHGVHYIHHPMRHVPYYSRSPLPPDTPPGSTFRYDPSADC